MRLRAPMLAFILGSACAEGRSDVSLDQDAIDADDPDSSGATGNPPSGGEGAQPEDGQGDGDETNDTPPTWSGEYVGEQTLGIVSGNGEWRELCAGEAVLEVSEQGTVTGWGECILVRGPATGEAIWLEYAGDAEPDGVVLGTATLSAAWRDATDELELDAMLAEEQGEQWMEAWMSGTVATRDGDAAVEGWAWGSNR